MTFSFALSCEPWECSYKKKKSPLFRYDFSAPYKLETHTHSYHKYTRFVIHGNYKP